MIYNKHDKTEIGASGLAIADPKHALHFMLGGNAYLTLRSKLTGVRYTYRVNLSKEDKAADQLDLKFQKQKPQASKPKTYFVSLLKGSDNQADYVYLGIIQDGNFRLTRKSKMTSQSIPVVAFAYAFSNLSKGRMPNQLEVWHHGRCGCCGRMLTVPEYKVNGVIVAGIAMGIGPECAGNYE